MSDLPASNETRRVSLTDADISSKRVSRRSLFAIGLGIGAAAAGAIGSIPNAHARGDPRGGGRRCIPVSDTDTGPRADREGKGRRCSDYDT